MTNNADAADGNLTTDMAALRADVGRLAETISGLVQHQTQAAGHRVSDAVGDARDSITGMATDMQARACGAISASVERNPVAAVLIALGVGMSLGLLSRLRG